MFYFALNLLHPLAWCLDQWILNEYLFVELTFLKIYFSSDTEEIKGGDTQCIRNSTFLIDTL